MTPTARNLLLAGLFVLLSGCNSSHFEPMEMQGPPAMVDDGGKARLWILGKEEEVRQVGVGGGGRHNSMHWRSDTFFHFGVEAFDPATARPLWRKRLLTIGDPEAHGAEPSRVIGSAVDGRLLGQEGDVVWLLIGDAPYAVSAADGSVVADADALQSRNPGLLLPSDSKHYGFDRGLVLMTADARQVVIRGAELKAVDYAQAPPPAAVDAPRPANGRLVVPMRPMGEVPARQVTLAGQWLGLYSPKEALDAGDDEFGDNYLYPYTILDEGTLARRTFWRADIADAQRFEDRFKRFANLTQIPGAPTFLKGRFVTEPRTGEPRQLDDPAGVLVWHSTRIDSAGRLALSRLDADLKTVWTTELPISETGTINPVAVWQLPDRLVAMGREQTLVDGVTSREPRLVSIDLRSGKLQGWDPEGDAALP